LSDQKLDLNLINKLTKMPSISIDEYMVVGCGFKKIESQRDTIKYSYEREYNMTI